MSFSLLGYIEENYDQEPKQSLSAKARLPLLIGY
jgi:hypothetical protein